MEERRRPRGISRDKTAVVAAHVLGAVGPAQCWQIRGTQVAASRPVPGKLALKQFNTGSERVIRENANGLQ